MSFASTSIMRLSRSLQLYQEQASLHLFWRCHNKEAYLNSDKNKSLYMQAIKDALKPEITSNNVFIHGFCVMSNHYHQATSYTSGSPFLSCYMRQAHSLFGARYNRAYKRSGKVAESRPKTSLIEDISHEMRVHFYIEANPIRAGMKKFENLHSYKYSSFKYYAYGIEDENTCILTIPEWYKELGLNPQERQKKYRRLFREYLNQEKASEYKSTLTFYKEYFIGSVLWIEKQRDRLKADKNTS